MFGCDTEIYAETIETIRANLTSEEVEEVVKAARRFHHTLDGAKLLYKVRDVADQVRTYDEPLQGTLAHWMGLGLDILTDGMTSFGNWTRPSWSRPDYSSIDELRTRLESEIAEWDTEDWSAAEVSVIRAWAAQTPYRVWEIVSTVEERAMDELRGQLYDLAREQDDGKNLARRVRDDFDSAVRDWEQKQ